MCKKCDEETSRETSNPSYALWGQAYKGQCSKARAGPEPGKAGQPRPGQAGRGLPGRPNPASQATRPARSHTTSGGSTPDQTLLGICSFLFTEAGRGPAGESGPSQARKSRPGQSKARPRRGQATARPRAGQAKARPGQAQCRAGQAKARPRQAKAGRRRRRRGKAGPGRLRQAKAG